MSKHKETFIFLLFVVASLAPCEILFIDGFST